MSVCGIPMDQWSEFLDQFSRGIAPGWRRSTVCSRTPSVTPKQSNDRFVQLFLESVPGASPGIEIRFQQHSHADKPIAIERPTSVRVDETADGTARSLEITDEEGECTRSGSVPRPCLRCWTASRLASCRNHEYRETTSPHKTRDRRNHGCIGRHRQAIARALWCARVLRRPDCARSSRSGSSVARNRAVG